MADSLRDPFEVKFLKRLLPSSGIYNDQNMACFIGLSTETRGGEDVFFAFSRLPGGSWFGMPGSNDYSVVINDITGDYVTYSFHIYQVGDSTQTGSISLKSLVSWNLPLCKKYSVNLWDSSITPDLLRNTSEGITPNRDIDATDGYYKWGSGDDRYEDIVITNGDNTGWLVFDLSKGLPQNHYDKRERLYGADPTMDFSIISLVCSDSIFFDGTHKFNDTSGYILLGDNTSTKLNKIKLYSNSISSYPPYLKCITASHDNTRFNLTTGLRQHVRNYFTTKPSQVAVQKDSLGNSKRLYLKFSSLPSLRSYVFRAYLKMYLDSASDSNRILSINPIINQSIAWDSTNSSVVLDAQLENIYNSAISQNYGKKTIQNVIDTTNNPYFIVLHEGYISGQNIFDVVEGYDGSDPIYSLGYLIKLGATTATIILEDIDNTNAVDPTKTISAATLGKNDVSGSDKQSLKTFKTDSTNGPGLIFTCWPPQISLSTYLLEAELYSGDTTSFSLDIENTGYGTLHGSIYDLASFANILPGTTVYLQHGEKSTQTITFTAGVVGDYTGLIAVADTVSDNTIATVELRLHVISGASIKTDKDSMSKTYTTNRAVVSLPIQIWDGSVPTGDSITYKLTSDQSWLTFDTSTGTSNSPSDKKTHNFIFTPGFLSNGTYNANVYIDDTGQGLQKIIPVEMIININCGFGATYDTIVL